MHELAHVDCWTSYPEGPHTGLLLKAAAAGCEGKLGMCNALKSYTPSNCTAEFCSMDTISIQKTQRARLCPGAHSIGRCLDGLLEVICSPREHADYNG